MTPDYEKIWRLALAVVGSLFAIFILLNLLGKVFIEEMSQNLFVEQAGAIDNEVAAISEVSPYFELQNLNGKLIKITDYKGSPVVVVFWNSWNDIAVSQIKILDEMSDKYSKIFKILTINNQEKRESVANFIRRGSYNKMEVLLDVNGGIGDAYEARNMPAFYFIDKNGLLMDKYYGFLDEKQIVEKMSKFSN
ncbi:MAG TPA: TlpA disulfide reductase family protein [Candidatus Paceibacterota bacterium]|nr:TlpA disulfide reductase family protein [Candidatus Paceibacterota bacterium]